MRILITGGLGFIGRHLTKTLLSEGTHNIVIVDSLTEQVHGQDPDHSDIIDLPNVEFIYANICEKGILEKALKGVDIVYHLAAETGTGQSMYQIEQYYQTNVIGTAILMEEIIKNSDHRPKRVILSSSRSVYGEGAYVKASATDPETATRYYPKARSKEAMDNGHFDFEHQGIALVPVATRENDQTDPLSLYAASKLSQEHICEISCASINVEYTALRLQNVYGPGQSLRNPYTGIMSIFTNILRQNGKINIFEDGLESRDFIFVKDVAKAFCAVLDLAPGAANVINVGTGIAVSVQDMVDILEEKMGTTGRSFVSGDFRPGDIRHNFSHIQKMNEILGVTCNVGLRDGLSHTVDWALTQPIEEDRSSKAIAELKSAITR